MEEMKDRRRFGTEVRASSDKRVKVETKVKSSDRTADQGKRA